MERGLVPACLTTTDAVARVECDAILPAGPVLVNVSRRSGIDEDVLYDALTSGKLFAVSLDVFRDELNSDLHFAAVGNPVSSPHVASASKESATW